VLLGFFDVGLVALSVDFVFAFGATLFVGDVMLRSSPDL
jgi:hypothetical protein